MYHIDFHYDLESRSHLDLKTVGPINYWAHMSTEITRITWKFSRTGPVKIWRPLLEPIPHELIDVILHPEKYNFIAWNILFDFLGWICKLIIRVPGGKRPPLECLNDAMALSSHFRTGASLEAAAKMMNLPINKDPEGRRIMLKQCKPGRNGQYAVLTPQEEEHFDRYSMIDTRILADVWYMLPPLPEAERYAWEWTIRRNLEGVAIDMELVAALDEVVAGSLPSLEAEFAVITGGLKINSHERVIAWFKQYYPHIESMDASNIRDLLVDTRPVPPFVRRALEIKDLSGSSAIAKLKSAKNLNYFGRMYELLAYHHAQTKRWAGRGIQIQNFPRVRKRPDSTKFDMNTHDLATTIRALRPGLKDPVGFVKNLLRRVWLPDPGEQFYCGDFAKVEPSVLFWLCGLGAIPKMWYETMAAAIYNKKPEEIEDGSTERTIGKIANLSCQYGTGGDGYRKALHKDTGIVLSEEEGKNVVSTYRRENPKIVQFWGDLQNAFRLAIYGQVSSLCDERVHFIPLHLVNHNYKGVAIRLPSGSYLYYHKAEETVETFTEESVELRFGVPTKIQVKKQKKVLRYLSDLGGGKIGWAYVYGGKLCENVVSATARDIIIPATWQLENAGFKILGLVHDEIWGSAVPGRNEEFTRLMCVNPSWCDMPIGADLKVGVRYLK